MIGPAPAGAVDVWSTSAVEPLHAFEYWRDLICDTFVQLSAVPIKKCSFAGQIVHADLAAFEISTVRASGQRVRRTPRLIAWAGEEYLLASIQTKGHGRIEQDGRVARDPVGSTGWAQLLGAFPAADQVHDVQPGRADLCRLLAELLPFPRCRQGAGPGGQQRRQSRVRGRGPDVRARAMRGGGYGLARALLRHGHEEAVAAPRRRVRADLRSRGQRTGRTTGETEEGLLFADLDFSLIAIAKSAADPVGHYSRPDVFRLQVNLAPTPKIVHRGAEPQSTAPEFDDVEFVSVATEAR